LCDQLPPDSVGADRFKFDYTSCCILLYHMTLYYVVLLHMWCTVCQFCYRPLLAALVSDSVPVLYANSEHNQPVYDLPVPKCLYGRIQD
jgi:hypothetical protein